MTCRTRPQRSVQTNWPSSRRVAFFGLLHLDTGGLGKFEDAFLGLLVHAESLVDGSAHLDVAALAFVGPFGKLDFCHQLRLDPVRAAGAVNLFAKGVYIGLQFLQQLPQSRMSGMSESAAGVAHVNEPAVLVIQPKNDRAEVLAAAARVGITADDALLAAGNFDLQPVARTLLHV